MPSSGVQAVERLTATPQSVADLAAHTAFLAQCHKARPEMDALCDDVVAHYDLCQDLGIALDPVEVERVASLGDDYQRVQDAMWSAETGREHHVVRFAIDLHRQVRVLSMHVFFACGHDCLVRRYSVRMSGLKSNLALLSNCALSAQGYILLGIYD